MLSRLKNLSLFRDQANLKKLGIMGMNSRNILYIGRYNQRQFYPLVDDKLKTKQLALEHQLNVPDLLGVIDNQHDVQSFQTFLPGHDGFCIKPSKGSGGKGILVVKYNAQGQMCRSNGAVIEARDIQRHISNILAGVFSLGGDHDVAMVESLIEVDDSLKHYSYEGVPDIRVIVFAGIPIMAMIRLSCSASKGKANLHQGAVGVGLDILSGQAIRAVQYGKPIDCHPDTREPLHSLQVKNWQQLLNLACACYDMTKLGYIGVDLVLDKNKGPILLELNARPGLAIQTANNTGLLPRLHYIENLKLKEPPVIEERTKILGEMMSALESSRQTLR